MEKNNSSNPFTILLADDDVDDRFFFNKALQEINISTQLSTVKDGEQLLNYLSENALQLPNLIFLDLSMPRMTGFECLIEIKTNELFKDIPIVVLTTSFGRGMDYEQTLINTLKSHGAYDYIRKPGNVEQLKIILQKILTVLTKKDHLSGKIS